MLPESLQQLPRLHVPDPHGGVRGAGDDDPVVVLEADDGPGVASEDLGALQALPVPDLDGVVLLAGDDLVVVVLEAVDSPPPLTPTVYLVEAVSPGPPVLRCPLDWTSVLGFSLGTNLDHRRGGAVETPVEGVWLERTGGGREET